MELLAPVGNIDTFYTALDAGADAVYVGMPGFNARNLARDISLEEIGAMSDFCRQRGKQLYLAANSLLLERELPRVVETLAVVESIDPAALIVQDIGLMRLIRRYFPSLTIHASTLAAAHNLEAVEVLARLGCERVVLARELTLAEIAHIAGKTEVELEVFIHGAMCFSYSGLCLFSSYLGGKSGLRGRCVQPCRRGYTAGAPSRKGGPQAAKGNYYFSMNDLDGLEAVAELKKLGVASLKIEGRLRSARYVEQVVGAYRLMLDASEEDWESSLVQARRLVEGAMSRKAAPGYFFSPQPADAISPMHSGNMGLHLGRTGTATDHDGQPWLRITLKEPLAVGDRLRLHFEPTGERQAFSLKGLRRAGEAVERGEAGQAVEMLLPPETAGQSYRFADCYKVDLAKDGGGSVSLREPLPLAEVRARIERERSRRTRQLQDITWQVYTSGHSEDAEAKGQVARKGGSRPGQGSRRGVAAKPALEWWLKLDSVKPLFAKMELRPDRYLFPLDKQNTAQAGELKRLLGKQVRSVSWCLPPVIIDRELGRLRKSIDILMRTGFRSFVLGHFSQVALFREEKVFLSADYSFNLLNNQALLMAAEAGFESCQLAIESDREGLQSAVQGYKQTGVPAARRGSGNRTMRLGLTVYGAPPLFTSRIAAPFLPYDRPVISPKNEGFVISRKDGLSQTRAQRPFSLLPYLHELKNMGIDYAVVDLTGGLSGKKEMQELAERLGGASRLPKLSTFNYLGRLE